MKYLVYIFILIFFSSCKMINPSQMLRTGADYHYSNLPEQQTIEEYKIAPNDKLSFMIYTNGGEKIIEPAETNSQGTKNNMTPATSIYLVENDGLVNLPVIGRVKLSGLTLREAESFLKEKYSLYYVQPFVQLSVTNNRVLIFPGSINGEAKVLYLVNSRTTLLEAIAQSGGIAGGKAYKIKLIRGELKNPSIYLIDLSTIEGMKKADIVLQANDIIYIEPRNRIQWRFAESVAPYVTLLSAIVLVITIFKLK